MHLILTGATGLVGSAALSAMLANKSIAKISILSRRPVRMAEDAKDPRVNVILHKDFTKFNDSELMEKLKDATGCVWALGISQTQVSADEYVKITKDYTLAAAEAFASLPRASNPASSETKPFDFVYVSGEGATLTPGRFTPIFGRVKGETELALAEVHARNPNFRAMSIRPGGVDPTGDETIAPYLPASNFIVRGGKGLLLGAIRVLAEGLSAPTKDLGQACVQMAMGAWEGRYAGVAGVDVGVNGGVTIVNNKGWKSILGSR